MYWGVHDCFVRDFQEVLLPCGHKIHSVILSGAVIKSVITSEEMLHWLENNGIVLTEATRAAEIAWGSFKDIRGEFSVHSRDMANDEYEDVMLHIDRYRLCDR